MTEERNNEFHNVVPLQIRFNDVDKTPYIFSFTTLVRRIMFPLFSEALTGIGMLFS